MRAIILAVFLWCSAPCGWCAQADPVQIKAEVDRQTATTDDLITCRIVITSALRQLEQPRLPDFKGFSIISQASSSTVSAKEGAVNTVLVFVFVLLPQETGSLTIAPAALKVDGREYTSQPLTVRVSQGTRRPDLPRYSL